jgi:ADP-dependent phosphofructokinase/glucokinase
MTYSPDETKLRLAKAKAKKEKARYNAAMKAAGFTHHADYDQWLVLEELRKINNPNQTVTLGGTLSSPTYTFRVS